MPFVSVLFLLAPRAKMRSALCHQNPAYPSAAMRAWLARFLIHIVANLKASLTPVEIDIVGDGRSARRNRLAKHSLDRRVQLPDPVPAQRGRHGQRMNSRAKQRFIRVDVSDPAQKSLI